MLPAGPAVWICGDCHVGNIGPVGGRTGRPLIELRDLDQTVIGNPAYDLVRLGLSLAMAARSSDLPGVTTAHMTEHLVQGYESAFEGEKPSEEVADLPEPIGLVMRTAIKRNWRALREERLANEPRFPLGKRFWPLTPEEREAVAALMTQESVRRLVIKLDEHDDRSHLRLLDAAYWVKGCSSLGLWRVAALVEVSVPGKNGKVHRTRSLIDIKEAIETWAPAAHRARLPADQAERVVTGARKIAPSLGERMATAQVLGHSVFIRELLPQDLKVELDELTSDEGKRVARYLGCVIGRAHQRQMTPAERTSWLGELTGYRTRNIDAPLWLWQAVIRLVADHEHAYLEHCRRYALDLTRPAQPTAAAIAR